MRMRHATLATAAITALAVIGLTAQREEHTVPVAKKVPKVREMHGDRFVDDYFWLREKTNPEVRRLPRGRERLHASR